MKPSAYISLVAVSVGLAFFWNVRENSAPTELGEFSPSAARLPDRAESAPAKPNESVDSESGEVEQPVFVEAADSALATRQKDMEDGIFQLVGPSVVRSLTQSGLAPSDSEEIARRLAADTAKCTMDSLRVEAKRQSISVDELLSQLRAAVGTGGELLDAVNLSNLQTSAFSCQAEAMQRAGIVYPSGVQVSEEQTKELMECVQAFSASDVDRGDILDMCTSEVLGEIP